MKHNLSIPKHLKGMDYIRYVSKHKDIVIAEKMSFGIKRADPCGFHGSIIGKTGDVTKAGVGVVKDDGNIYNTTVINTCLWYDSHGDVSLPKSWNKSIADNDKRLVNKIRLYQEHIRRFDKIIADKGDVKPYIAQFSWKQLGVDFDGMTEAVLFDNVIRPKRNPFMYDQYKEGNVDNHSAGLYYVTMDLAVMYEDKEFEEYNKTWKEWIDKIPNADEAKADGMFWAIKEQRLDEGSAVTEGSNPITPTFENSFSSTKNEPPTGTQEEPPIVKNDVFSWANKAFKN